MTEIELYDQPATGSVVCGQNVDHCICIEVPDHETPHVCVCGGSWSYNKNGEFHVHVLPGTQSAGLKDFTRALLMGMGFRDSGGSVGD